MTGLLAWFTGLGFPAFLAVLTAANVAMYLASWALVSAVQRARATQLLNAGRPRISRADSWLSLLIVLVNIAVGVPGWLLWKTGWITLEAGGPARVALELALIVAWFDIGMYALHRLAHTPWLYDAVHARHHGQVDVSGRSFYIMNPVEAVGFGLLLIALLVARPWTIEALLGFLALNWLYGTMGHSGVPVRSRALAWLVGDSAFHHRHHATPRGNFGFYTPVWDKLFGTDLGGEPAEG